MMRPPEICCTIVRNSASVTWSAVGAPGAGPGASPAAKQTLTISR